MLKTEEPGTKQILAFQNDRIESVCHDNHLINDCVVMGAEPLAVQDLVVCGRLEKSTVTRIVSAVSEGCVLTGGETTEQPDILPTETYILGFSIVGVVDFENVIDGTNIEVGDSVVAVASSGSHSNGYTLIRDLLVKHPSLKPHRCYYQSIKDLFDGRAVGLAHITGGGIKENLNRILPAEVNAEIDLDLYKPPLVFEMIQRVGGVSAAEMLRTFNLGVGLTIVCRDHNTASSIDGYRGRGRRSI